MEWILYNPWIHWIGYPTTTIGVMRMLTKVAGSHQTKDR